MTWADVTASVQRLRNILPNHFPLVDIDDGFCDIEVAALTVRVLETIGASAVMLEDQRRPRRCGHFGGKQILDLDDHLEQLEQVLRARNDLFVLARTDSADHDDILRRVEAFDAAGADGVLVDGILDLDLINEIRARVKVPIALNQIAGGKSPAVTLSELAERVSQWPFTRRLRSSQRKMRSKLRCATSMQPTDGSPTGQWRNWRGGLRRTPHVQSRRSCPASLAGLITR